VPAPPAPLQSRTGKALKWTVSALLIVALGLGSWQLADTLMDRVGGSEGSDSSRQKESDEKKTPTPRPLEIQGAAEYFPDGTPQHTDQVPLTHDGDPVTYWRTKSFNEGPDLNPAFKKGVGIIYDLGTERAVNAASIGLLYSGDHTTVTLYSTDSLSSSTPLESMDKLATVQTSDTTADLTLQKPATTQYVVVWMTAMPYSDADDYTKAGYKQAITDVTFTG
jgi:hypothetical protein